MLFVVLIGLFTICFPNDADPEWIKPKMLWRRSVMFDNIVFYLAQFYFKRMNLKAEILKFLCGQLEGFSNSNDIWSVLELKSEPGSCSPVHRGRFIHQLFH